MAVQDKANNTGQDNTKGSWLSAWLRPLAWLLHCTAWVRSMASGSHRKPSPVGPSTLNLYTRCSDLPLSRFIRLVVDKDMDALVINPALGYEGNREGIWAMIFGEYMELTGDENFKELLRLTNDIESIKFRIDCIHRALNLLRKTRHQVLIDALSDAGYKVEDGDNYYKSLDKIGRKAAALGVELRQKQVALEKLQSSLEGKAINTSYFDELVIELQRFMGFRIDTDVITTKEFAIMTKRMRSHLKAQATWHQSA